MKKPLYTIVDVKKTCNELLQTTFPDITVYGNGVYDGYTRPSFFTEILETYNNLSPYQRSRGYSYKITYFETTHDEKRCLEIYEEILYVFGIDVTIRTDERKIRLLVDSIDFQWIDTNADKMQITIDFADTVQIGGRTETEDIAESCETVVRKESEGE